MTQELYIHDDTWQTLYKKRRGESVQVLYTKLMEYYNGGHDLKSRTRSRTRLVLIFRERKCVLL
jgi:hypothetical protein